jgi:hypothetical protein
MTDPAIPLDRIIGEEGSQVVEATALFPGLDRVPSIHHGKPGRIVAPILEPSEPVEEDGSCVRLAYIPNDTTHNFNKF